jgi:hypothetical protein
VKYVGSQEMRNKDLEQMKGKSGEVMMFELITEKPGYCRVSIIWDDRSRPYRITGPRTSFKLIT